MCVHDERQVSDRHSNTTGKRNFPFVIRMDSSKFSSAHFDDEQMHELKSVDVLDAVICLCIV